MAELETRSKTNYLPKDLSRGTTLSRCITSHYMLSFFTLRAKLDGFAPGASFGGILQHANAFRLLNLLQMSVFGWMLLFSYSRKVSSICFKS